MASSAVVQELAITAELCGWALTPAGAKALLAELQTEREDDLLVGLRMMRREHRGRFSCADVLDFARQARRDRIDAMKRCLWCPVEAQDGSDYCREHTAHHQQIEDGRLKKIDKHALTRLVFKNV